MGSLLLLVVPWFWSSFPTPATRRVQENVHRQEEGLDSPEPLNQVLCFWKLGELTGTEGWNNGELLQG